MLGNDRVRRLSFTSVAQKENGKTMVTRELEHTVDQNSKKCGVCNTMEEISPQTASFFI